METSQHIMILIKISILIYFIAVFAFSNTAVFASAAAIILLGLIYGYVIFKEQG